MASKKILIVSLSRTNNTKTIAEIIHKNVGGALGSGFQTVNELCTNSKALEGFATTGGVEKDGVYFVIKGERAKEAETEVKKWLQKIKVRQ